ncbi:hypothetical protein ACS0TY_007197 [Phlomoides rotata]
MSIEPLLNLDKITANKPTRIIILCNNSRFKNSSYIALNKHRKNRTSIIREAHLPNNASYRCKIMNIMDPSGAGNSNESFVFSRKTSHNRGPLRFVSSLIPCLPFLAMQSFNFQNHAVVILVSIASTSVIRRLLQSHRFWKRVINLFKGTKKCVKEKPEEIKKTSVAPNPKLWRLTSEDLLVTMDAYKIEYFVYNMCMMLVWWVISRLASFVRRFYSKNNRK